MPAPFSATAVTGYNNYEDALADLANHTLVCFHSKKGVKLPDGKLQATG